MFFKDSTQKLAIDIDYAGESIPAVPKSYIQVSVRDLRGYLNEVAKSAKTSSQKGECDRICRQINNLEASLEKGLNPIAATNQIMTILPAITLLAQKFEQHTSRWEMYRSVQKGAMR